MKNTSGKSAPITITTVALLSSSMVVVEGRELYHTELRQYVEPSKLTHENAAATATFITGTVGVFGWDSRDFGPPSKFEVRLKSGGAK